MSQVAQLVKNLPAKAEDTSVGQIPGSGRSPRGRNGNPWKIPWTEEPGGSQV